MAEHFGDAFNRHSVAEGYGGGEGVASDMEGEILRDVAMRGYLLEGIVEISGSMCDYLAPASSAGVMEVIAPLGRSDL